ncbi:tryptophan synthase subunit alpha [Aminipila butyrica]|uniref:Tryptophan synthase alpha chain n=1 Tax=Aminipila butyrica TaxID=433296 RepID=A0A858BU97_9FIRM|nr:tryptophan synthase subunit alpha [Aminipila butyrica]QIB69147.1 tryptophan synthase subunit alpha [Aminipila butyrica]
MSRIKDVLIRNGKEQKALVAFLTAGDPGIEQTKDFIRELIRAGADLIEIGIPFSDPIAEGPVIQNANLRALAGGVDTNQIFQLAAEIRQESSVPLVFMTYLNLVFHYGYEGFFSRCQQAGVDGIILPDLPFEEKREVADIADKYGVDVISLLAPTSENRIRVIAEEAQGFIYLVSSMGVTGVRETIDTDLESLSTLIRKHTAIPCFIGFGISRPEQAVEMAAISDGVIVGSAIVKLIETHGNEAGRYIYEYVRSMKEAVMSARP